MYDQILKETKGSMDKAVQHLEHEIKGLRSGRATPALVDNIKVDYYGSPTPLKQLATVTIPEPRTLAIKPFDVSALKEIEKAIQVSDLGVNPQSDGKLIRVTIPMMSEDQRKKLVTRLKDMAEQARVALRNIRRDANKRVDGAKSSGDLTEDDVKQLKEEVQDATKACESRVDEILKSKSVEIMEA